MASEVKKPRDPAVLEAEAQLKDIIQNLYNLMLQTNNHHGPLTQDAIKREIQSLLENLVRLSRSAPAVQFTLPPELIQYVESTRNPDVFTREFVELAQRTNQLLKGRSDAYRLLRDTLAKDIVTAIPELKDDVARICQSTGDKLPT